MLRTLAVFLLLVAWLSAATVRENVEFARRGNTPLFLDASVPDGAGPFPAVIIVHGGGFMRGNKTTYVTPMFQPLTKAGFAWFTVDYRLVPEVQVTEQVDDVTAALAWVHQHAAEYKVDRKRIALLGESAGAYLVDYTAITAPITTRVAAVVSFYGPHDLLFQAQKTSFGERMTAITGIPRFDADGQAKLRALSPYYMVRKGLPPFLLLHGTGDEQVPYEQSPRFCKALVTQGNQCELYTVPGARHGMGAWEQHADQQAYKAKVVDWLKQMKRKP